MNAAQATHPSHEKLAAFGSGRLGAPESAEIEQHLAECAACCGVLKTLPNDTLVALLADSKADTKTEASEPDQAPPTNDGQSSPCTAALPRGSEAATLAPARDFTRVPEKAQPTMAGEVPAELQNHPRYQVIALLGRGGMGSVYRAQHRMMNRPVALKVIDRQLVQTPGLVERFQREVQAAARLAHPNIVTAHDAEQAADLHFLAMELVEGKDLAQVVAERGPLPVRDACEYIRQAAAGLQHAHSRGMVHRDIKPQNLMLTQGSPLAPREEAFHLAERDDYNGDLGQIKILDFGLAQFASEIAEVSGLTQVGAMMGTPDYMAPEQARDAHSADIRADIYSLGCTLYYLLAGHSPFPRGTVLERILAHVERDPTPLAELRDDVPPELASVLAKMMAKSPADRYQTPADVAEALAPFAQRSLLAPREEAFHLAERDGHLAATRRRRRMAIAFTALALVAILAGVIVITTDKGRIEIQSDVDDVEVVVKHGGKEVDVIDAQTGSHVKWFPSGKYEIELKEGRNDIQIVNGGFKLTRWGKEVVTLKHKAEAIASSSPTLGDGWEPLFNGRDLTGWKTFPEIPGKWRVDQGSLVGSGNKVSYLVHEREFDDFHLSAEVRVNSPSDAGIYFRAPYKLTPNGEAGYIVGYEAQIGENGDYSTGDLAIETGQRASWLVLDQAEKSLAKPNEWFHFEILAQGKRLEVKVNGRTATKYEDNDFRLARGHIALQLFKPGTVVEFRKIAVRELRTSPPPAIAPFDAEQAKKLQEAWASHLGVPVEYTNSIGMKLRLIPPGQFLMGSTEEPAFAQGAADEFQHEVVITQPFRLGVHTVTVGQFRAFVKEREYKTEAEKSGGATRWFARGNQVDPKTNWLTPGFEQTDDHPVTCVSWNDALAFCAWLSEKEGQQYALPTEAQWEYASRAGSQAAFYFGDKGEDLALHAWYAMNSEAKTHAVGRKKSNGWGLFDMHGNVWQWVADRHQEDYYRKSPRNDPPGPDVETENRLFRGGSWVDGWQPAAESGGTWLFRSARRQVTARNDRANHMGFRVVLPVQAVRQALAGTPKLAGSNKFVRDQQAAEWIVRIGGTLRVNIDGVERHVAKAEEIPTGDWQITEICVWPARFDETARLDKLAGLQRLRWLRLFGCQISDEGLEGLTNVPSLTFLDLDYNHVTTDRSLRHIGRHLTSLTYLGLHGTAITDEGLAHLSPLKSLRGLNLSATRLTGSGLAHLASFGSLRDLYLGPATISDDSARHLSQLSALEILRLQQTPLTDAAVEHLVPLKNLKTLDIGESKISPAGVEKLRAALPTCAIEGLTTGQREEQWKSQVASVTWTSLEPTKHIANGGATLRRLEDSSLLAEGPNPAQAIYTVVCKSSLKRVTALRLDVLRDSRLPKNGPGRHDNGSFVLSGFEIRFSQDLNAPERSVTLRRSFADYSQGGHDAAGFAKPGKGSWAIWRESEPQLQNQSLVLDLVEPLILGEDSTISVTLRHESTWDNANLGRFRLSATDADRAPLDKGNSSVWPQNAPPPAIAPFGAEQAKMHQEAWAKHLGVPVEYSNSLGMKFRLIPPGEFLMGSTPEQIKQLLAQAQEWDAPDWYFTETPQEHLHRVRITRSFYLGMHEVTQEQYEKIMGVNPSAFAKGGVHQDKVSGETGQHPVEMLSWDLAREFCRRLSVLPQEEKPMGAYRLPTEAEWEYACRAGTATINYAGDKEADLREFENVPDQSIKGVLDEAPRALPWNDGFVLTSPVGHFRPNPFGLFDMLGNVGEWCQEFRSAGYYLDSPENDPPGPEAGTWRIRRGGTYRSREFIRSAFRPASNPAFHDSDWGVRAVLSVDAVRNEK